VSTATESLSKVDPPASGYDWKDINDEKQRTYTFPGGHQVTVYAPSKLAVKSKSNGDSHRIEDKFGNGHYIPAGWLMISWKVKDGSPAVAF
jgi:hypothetical protein